MYQMFEKFEKLCIFTYYPRKYVFLHKISSDCTSWIVRLEKKLWNQKQGTKKQTCQKLRIINHSKKYDLAT